MPKKSKKKSNNGNLIFIVVLLVVAIIVLLFFLKTNEADSNKAERAANAMAESSCLLFDEELTFEDIGDMTKEIVVDYGFQSPEEIDSYLISIAGTEEENTVSVFLAEALEANCGDALVEKGLDPTDMSQAILTE